MMRLPVRPPGAELLAVIDALHFCAGIILRDDRVIEATSIVRYMAKQRWTCDRVRTYCAEKGWRVSIVHEARFPGHRR